MLNAYAEVWKNPLTKTILQGSIPVKPIVSATSNGYVNPKLVCRKENCGGYPYLSQQKNK